MKDYLLTFKVQAEMSQLDEMTRQLVAIAERTKSDVAGGCDARRGEFYINTGRRFAQADLLEMVALVLPNTSNLTIAAIAPADLPLRPRSANRAKRKSDKASIQQRGRTRAVTPKSPAKV